MNKTALSFFDGQLIDGLDFCSKVFSLFESIRATEIGRSHLRMRKTSPEKKLIQELLPISQFVLSKYRIGLYLSVKWIDGSQQFDAQINQSGFYVDQGFYPPLIYLEVTCVMHPNDYLQRELLDKNGTAFGLEGIRRQANGEIDSVPVLHKN